MEAQSLFFLYGLRKQVTYVRTHNKSISKLDFTTTWATLASPFQKMGNANILMLLFLKIM